MSKPIETNMPGFKVRIHIRPTVIHAFSTTEPTITTDDITGRLLHVAITQDSNSDYGDTIGFIDWSQVGSVTWKKTEEPKAPKPSGRPAKITSENVSAEIAGPIRKDALIASIASKFSVSEKTASKKIEEMLTAKEIIVSHTEPRPGGGIEIVYLTKPRIDPRDFLTEQTPV